MNKKERAKVEEAIFNLMENEGADYSRGIGLLCELIGQRYPAYHDTQDMRSVTLAEIIANPGEFRYRE